MRDVPHRLTCDAMNRRAFIAQATASSAFAFWGTRVAFAAASSNSTRVVETTLGKVRGQRAGEVESYKGIPYAASTAGRNRFMPPQPRKPWSGVYDAFEHGDCAPQSGWKPTGSNQAAFWSVFESSAKISENCLNLAIWTRGGSESASRPVMVWFFGGGYDHGNPSAPGYDGAALARNHDVVVVNVGHRLGVLGYGYFAEAKPMPPPNVGHLDLVAALEWIRDNIAAFGGDPRRVMLFGESGGGGKVGFLMGMPRAQGLFHAAAIESVTGFNGNNPQSSAAATTAMFTRAGLQPDQFRELQDVSFERITGIPPNEMTSWRPVADGQVLPADPFSPEGINRSGDIPLIYGYNRTEGTAGTMDGIKDPILDEAGLTRRVGQSVGDGNAAEVIAVYRQKAPRATPYEIAMNIVTDYAQLATERVAERRAALGRAPTYHYVFAWETPIMSLRSPHTIELPFVFENLDGCTGMVGPVTPPMRALAAQIAGAWAALARTGNPNHSGLPRWEPYTAARRETLVFDAPSRTEMDRTNAVRKAYELRAAGRTKV